MTNVQLISAISDLTKKNIRYRRPTPEQIKSFFADIMKTSDTFVKENASINYVKIKSLKENEQNISKLLNEYRLKKINKK